MKQNELGHEGRRTLLRMLRPFKSYDPVGYKRNQRLQMLSLFNTFNMKALISRVSLLFSKKSLSSNSSGMLFICVVTSLTATSCANFYISPDSSPQDPTADNSVVVFSGSETSEVADTKAGNLKESNSESGSVLSRENHPGINSSEPSGKQELGAELPDFSRLKASAGHEAEIVGLFPIVSGGQYPFKLISCDISGVCLLWDLQSGKSYELSQIGSGARLTDFNERNSLLATARPNIIEIFSLSSAKRLYSLTRLETRVTEIDFHPSGDSLLIAGADGRIYRWKFQANSGSVLEREKTLERYVGHASVVSSVAYHPFGRVFFSGDWRGALNAWLAYDADEFGGKYDRNLFRGSFFSERATRVRAKRASNEQIDHVRASDDGEALFVASENGSLEYWSVRGFQKESEIKAHKGLMYSLEVSPSGRRVVSTGRDGFLRVWEVVESKLIMLREVQMTSARQAAFINETRIIAGSAAGGVLEVLVE